MLRGKKILITGGAGFLGSHLVKAFINKGARVSVIDNMDSGRPSNLPDCPELVYIQGDLTDFEQVRSAVSGSDMVVHTAIPMALRRQDFSFQQLAASFQGFLHLLDACLRESSKLVEISSIAVYGTERYTPIDEDHPLDPDTVYGGVKASEEFYCRTLAKTKGLKMVILRAADIYGPRNTRVSVPIRFLLQSLHHQRITVSGDGTQGLTLTYVSDFVQGVTLAMAREGAGGIYNIAGERFVSIGELAAAVDSISGGKCGIEFIPGGPEKGRRLDIDTGKARRELGFVPNVDLREGLEKTFRWLQQNPDYYPKRE